MQYRFKTDEGMASFDVDIVGADTLRVTDCTSAIDVSYSVISENEIYLLIKGIGYNAFITGKSGEKSIVINGISYLIQDADIAELTRKSRKGQGELSQEITPPMPSVVERIMVAVGDTVKKGDSVVVVAAMKMETTLTAPFDGQVTKINVSVGDKVMPGLILVNIEKVNEESNLQADS
jgi:biotin carboxyl carrier protein